MFIFSLKYYFLYKISSIIVNKPKGNVMRNLFIVIIINVLFLGCMNNQEVTQKDCKKQGKVFKVEKVLNFRTGTYEDRASCI